jgi:predicted metal-dependent enzyme (double-stranded beta helix superfamily)
LTAPGSAAHPSSVADFSFNEISMPNHNWLVTEQGSYRAFGNPDLSEPAECYRLYRFLTDLEDILKRYDNDIARLEAITPLVRNLLVSSYWLQMEYQQPDPATGWSVHFLYREHDFPITIQMVAWQPGHQSPIHNHGTWGLVAIVDGQERNRLWQRQPHVDFPDHITPTQELVLNPGDIIALTADAIHSVEPLGDEPTISFNLYGITNFQQRYQFDPEQQKAQRF